MRSKFRRILFVLAMASLASGCAVGPDLTDDELQAEIDDWIDANEQDGVIQVPSDGDDVGYSGCDVWDTQRYSSGNTVTYHSWCSYTGSGTLCWWTNGYFIDCEAVSCTCVS